MFTCDKRSNFLLSHVFLYFTENMEDFDFADADFRRQGLLLTLFLENHHGPSYNKMMRDLCRIYLSAIEDGFDYLPSAIACATAFANQHCSDYWAKFAPNKDFFHQKSRELIACAATNIALDARAEFEIGNLYETAQ